MKLKELLAEVTVIELTGSLDIEIKGLHTDSRAVRPNELFIAVVGTQTDGHDYIDKAIDLGATAIVHSKDLTNRKEGVSYVRVGDTAEVVGVIATEFYGRPTEKLKLVGVTGTNGKTTVATVLYDLFRAMGHKVGLCSTVCNYIDNRPIPSTHTTPDPITLNALLAEMVEEGCEYAFMECSSHAIAQRRIGGLNFVGGLFTNLTRDHLDYHKTFENYRDSKKRFFDDLPKSAFAITNIDDRNGNFMVQNCKASVKRYSTHSIADFKGKIVEESLEGMLLDIDGREVSVAFIGQFNVSNLLAVYGAAIMLGKSPEEVLRIMSMLRPVNGRFEAIRSENGINAVIDYAHTPDALINVLDTINEIVRHRSKVITVCGAGGNRDKGKRPLMAIEAVKRSDRVILTSDNPRFENPEMILDDMEVGLDAEQRRRTLRITDRRQAIRTAVQLAEPGDVILIAGKGHESYQEIEGVKHHFDDHEEVRVAFGL